MGPPASFGNFADARGNHFVERNHHQLFHRGHRFRVAGANNYYPMYASQTMVDDLFNKAAASSFNVMRFWGFLDIGNQDGSNSVAGIKNGVYLHYWNGSAPGRVESWRGGCRTGE